MTCNTQTYDIRTRNSGKKKHTAKKQRMNEVRNQEARRYQIKMRKKRRE